MRPKQRETSKSDDLFRARLDQIINPRHELVRLAAEIDWTWIDGEIAPLYSEHGRPAVPTRFMIGLLLLKHIYALSDEDVCERWVENPYFQFFTGGEFFQHAFRTSARAEPLAQATGRQTRAAAGREPARGAHQRSVAHAAKIEGIQDQLAER